MSADNDWAQMREDEKAARKDREETNSDLICAWCNETGANYREIADWHVRVTHNNITLDIFPQSKKYHNVTANSRGKIKGSIADFLNNIFYE